MPSSTQRRRAGQAKAQASAAQVRDLGSRFAGIEKRMIKDARNDSSAKMDKAANLGTRTMMSGRTAGTEDGTNIRDDSWATGHPKENARRTNNYYAGKKTRAAETSGKTAANLRKQGKIK